MPTTESVLPSYLYVFWPWGIYRMPAGFTFIDRSTTYYFWKVITQIKYSRSAACKSGLNYVRVDINLRGQSLGVRFGRRKRAVDDIELDAQPSPIFAVFVRAGTWSRPWNAYFHFYPIAANALSPLGFLLSIDRTGIGRAPTSMGLKG